MLRPLPTDVVQHLRSGVAITSVSHCVEELVINSIDASASCIAVRLNLPFFKIQVIDNGNGIDYDNMEHVGIRYATSKCHSIDDLHTLKSGGFRGEALASLKDISSVLTIESRSSQSKKTYCKIFTHGLPPKVHKANTNRPSKGTTVTVHDFMYNMPVRKQCISNALDVEDCRKSLEKFSLIHPQISFSLRDDATGKICLETKKCDSTKSAFMYLFGREKADNLKEILVNKNAYNVHGFISVEGHSSKDLQLAYVNKRYIHRTKLQKLVSAILKKFLFSRSKPFISKDSGSVFPLNSVSPSKFQTRYAVFILNVTCPYDEYDIILEPRKTIVEFINWEKILKIIEEAVFQFLKNNNFWSEMENTVELSTENSIQSTSANNSCIFPDDLGKDIAAEDNKNGLFSIPAKRVQKSDNNLRISPIKKARSSLNQNKIPKEIINKNESEQEVKGKFVSLKFNASPNLISAPGKVKIVPHEQSHSEPPTSALSCFDLPETEVCLKEISEMLGKKKQEKSETNEADTHKKPTNTLPCLKKFQYAEKKVKFELHQKRNTQKEKHVSINPIAEEIHQPKFKSKYVFGNVLDQETLIHLRHLKQKKLKPTLHNRNNKEKHQSISALQKENESKEKINSENINCDKTTSLIHEDLTGNHQKKSSSAFKESYRTSKTCSSKEHKGNNIDPVHVQNKIYDDSKIHKSNQIIHRKERTKSRYLLSRVFKSPIGNNNTSKRTHYYSPSKYYSKNRKPSFNSSFHSIKATKYNLERRKSLSEHVTHQRRKMSPKELIENRSILFSKFSKINSEISSPSTSFFAHHSIDDLRKRGRLIIDSSPESIECDISKDETNNPFTAETPNFYSKNSGDHKNIFDQCSIEQLFNIKFNKSISSESLLSPVNHSLSKYEPNDILVCSKNPQDFTSSFPLSKDQRYFKSTSKTLVHNNSKNSIWKEVPDSPPSPYNQPPVLAVPQPQFKSNISFNNEYFFSESHRSISKNHSEKCESKLLSNTLQSSVKSNDKKQNETLNSNNCDCQDTSNSSCTIDGLCKFVSQGDDPSINILPNSSKLCLEKSFETNKETVDSNVSNKDISAINSSSLIMPDPAIHKKVIIDKISENSNTLSPPISLLQSEGSMCQNSSASNDQPIEGDGNENQFFSTHDSNPLKSILLNEPQKKGTSELKTMSLHNQSLEEKLVNDIKEQRNSDLSVKWNAEELKTMEVENLFSNWENPIFQRSSTEIEVTKSSAITQNLMPMYGVLNSYRFSKIIFENLQVIGQVDHKFIACLVKDVNEDSKGKKILVLFDQHAVHERVRLEKLMADFYDNNNSTCKQAWSTPLSSPVEIHLSPSEARLVNIFSKYLKRLGISLSNEKEETVFQIFSVPQCLLDRANNEPKRNRMLAISSLVESIIKEWIILVEQTRNPVTTLPKSLTGILNSQACKGAIKFGDPLDQQQCVALLESLSTCNLPFQCAHGRPSLAPILNLEKIGDTKKKCPPNLKKLSELIRYNHSN